MPPHECPARCHSAFLHSASKTPMLGNLALRASSIPRIAGVFVRSVLRLHSSQQTSKLAAAPRSYAPSASLAPLALQFMRSALRPGHAGGICHKMNLKAFSFILWPVLPCFWLNPYHSMNEDPLIFILWPANEYVRVWLRTRKDSGCLLRPLVDKFSWLFI